MAETRDLTLAEMVESNRRMREALTDAYRFITQPQRMTRDRVTYSVLPYNALTAKIRTALHQFEEA